MPNVAGLCIQDDYLKATSLAHTLKLRELRAVVGKRAEFLKGLLAADLSCLETVRLNSSNMPACKDDMAGEDLLLEACNQRWRDFVPKAWLKPRALVKEQFSEHMPTSIILRSD